MKRWMAVEVRVSEHDATRIIYQGFLRLTQEDIMHVWLVAGKQEFNEA